MKTHKPVCVAVFDYRPANTTVIYSTRGALLALDMPRHCVVFVCLQTVLSSGCVMCCVKAFAPFLVSCLASRFLHVVQLVVTF